MACHPADVTAAAQVALRWAVQRGTVALPDGSTRTLPFSIRCDAAGLENYPDGTPKKWWSKLAVVRGGQEVQKKEIVVNDPLLYSGVRFYQSTYGTNGRVEKLTLAAVPVSDQSRQGTAAKQEIGLGLNDVASLDSDTVVRFAEFIPDYTVRDGRVVSKSNELRNPAARLVVTSKKAGKDFEVWVTKMGEAADTSKVPWKFRVTEVKVGSFTGLEVSHEPGQWGVWSGVVLLGIGLAFVFYLVHRQIWIVPVRDARTGKLSLWIGGRANRNRVGFEERFNDLVSAIEEQLKPMARSVPHGATRFTH